MTWLPEAFQQLETLIQNKKLEFYQDAVELQETITQVVKLDIRSSHQRNQAESTEEQNQMYNFRIDNLRVHFSFEPNLTATVHSVDFVDSQE